MPQTTPDVLSRVAATLPALSGRSIRNLYHVSTLRSMRRNVALAAALAALLLGGGYAAPAYAQETTTTRTLASQTLRVPAVAAASALTRDMYSVTAAPGLQWPVNPSSRIADGFGPRVAPCSGCSSYHEGVDFDAGYGAQVHAIAAGVVVETNSPGYSALGVHVRIQHIINGQAVTSVYGHMQTGSMRLHVGDAVAAGQVLGLVGSTGASTGAHLHFEIRLGGDRAVDPLAWMHSKLG
ncbi:MAG TPA: M23 family metallopeptidase [Lacisediminihabitans sp.]|nr:M23 family metallopeptidase [Lacisediminihabitans sp.]HXD62958.1 M23 family metallopeptidase [Lacisediminihabitans sp.]